MFKKTICLLTGLFSFQVALSQSKILNQIAPNFQAQVVFPDGSVEDFNLKDYVGKKVVLYFYPMDNTPGCTKQAKNFRDNIQKLYDKDIVIFGISCDSVKSHIAFQKKHHLPFPLISDSRLWQPIGKKYGASGFLMSKRKTILIDEQGIVFKVFDRVDIQNQINDILNCFRKHS